MWRRIIAYIVGIPLVFLGLLYAFSWHATRQIRIEGQKGLAEIAARENALDSLGEIALDPSTATLTDLERSLHQPNLKLAGMHNTTRIGWACAANDCEVWASFLQPLGTELDPGAIPLGFGIRDTVMRKRLHRISIGGVNLGEPVSEMLDYGKTRGYGIPVAYHHITWDKNWSVIWTDGGGNVSSLMFLNDKLIKAAQAGAASQAHEARH